jgi:hypothetical protein
MFTYQLQPRGFRFHPASPEFPSQATVILELAPSQLFGGVEGPCRILALGSNRTIKCNLNNGRVSGVSSPPLPAVDVRVPCIWRQTAAALAQMDLVIAVDSSLAHLAGALNRPVWIPLQAAVEWRWGLESPTTPWYPSARLFRQQRVHEWAPVFEQMAAELRERVERRKAEVA